MMTSGGGGETLATAVRNNSPVDRLPHPYRTARRIVVAGIAVSAALAGVNIVAGFLTKSSSVLAIGLEFSGDVLASGIVLLGMRAAARPADENHPYGHGRFEILAAFVVGIILVVAGAGICYGSLQAVGRWHPPPGAAAIVALIVAIVVRGIMSVLKFRVGRAAGSPGLVADAWNDSVDVLSAAGALTAVALATHDPVRFLAADHYGGFAVGLIVVFTGGRVLKDASLELADTMPPVAVTDEIRRVAGRVPGVTAVEKLYARKTGLQYHVDLHIEVDPEMSVRHSHAIATQVRATVTRELPRVADVLVHVEPGPDE